MPHKGKGNKKRGKVTVIVKITPPKRRKSKRKSKK